MKTKKILYVALCVLILGLCATSCNKVSLLDGTTWSCKSEGLTLSFTSKSDCKLKIEGEGSYDGEYSGKKDKIYIEWDAGGEWDGTIDGDTMKLETDNGYKLTFKKKD